MYEIWSDNNCIHNDYYLDKNYKVLRPKLTLEDNSSGQLTFVIPPNHKFYNQIKRLSSIITVKENGEFLWEGRIIDEQTDFWYQRHVTCEGELGYLNDTTQPPAEFHDYTVRQFLEALIAEHNRKVEVEKRFTIGAVTIHDANDSILRYTNSETTLRCIKEKLVEKFGGHIRTRHVNGIRYLDYLEDYPNTNTQEVRFGVNLLDFVKNFDMSKLATVIMPRGARLEDSPIDALEAYLTVESVNGGSIYVTSESAIKTYGWIEQVVDWQDVTEPANLLRKAKQYLNEVQFEEMVLELKAIDLKYLAKGTESIKLLDLVRCVSQPHGMDRYFPVSKVEIVMDQPEQSSYTFGDNIRISMTANNKKTSSDIIQKINELPTKSDILKSAKENAEEIINMATNGFITITKSDLGAEELYISDTRDYKLANRYWRWNLNGLGYFKKGEPVKVAITMDGAIVADFITTGTMSADRVRAGILVDQLGNTSWNLNTGVLTMKKGSITLGGGAFSVNDSGYLVSTYGKIGSFEIGTESLIGKKMVLRGDTIVFREGNAFYGEIGPGVTMGQGLCMDVLSGGKYISLGVSQGTQQSGEYFPIILYAKSSVSGFTAGQIHFQEPINAHGQIAQNLSLNPSNSGAEGGLTGNMNQKVITDISLSDGKVTSYSYTTIGMRFQRGFCTYGSW